MQILSVKRKTGRGIAGVCILMTLCSCEASRNQKPTPEQAKQLLKLRGYNPDQVSFFAAAAASDELAVNLFFAAGTNPNTKDLTTSPLIAAASRGDLEMVNALLQGGALVNQKDEKGFTALLRAIQNNQDEIADALLDRPDLDLNVQGVSGPTVLMSYVWRDQENTVKKLLERGANPNLSDEAGDTALHGAALRGNAKVLRMLLDKGANPNAKNKVGGAPLMWAGTYGNEEAARVLIENGADAALKDEDGMTASAWAAKNKRDEMARWLRDAEKKRQPVVN